MSLVRTSRERLLAAIRREAVDYVPLTPFFNPLTQQQREGRAWNFPWPEGASLRERLEYEVSELGVDPVVSVGANLCRPAQGVASKVWRDGNTLHKAYTTQAGELHASVRLGGTWPHGNDIPFYSDFNIGHFIEPWVRTEQDLACLKDILRLADNADAVESARQGVAGAKTLAEEYGLATMANVGTGLTGAQQLFGAADLCLAVVDSPALVDAYLEHEHQLTLRTLEVLGDCGVDLARRNGFYETADFYGPERLEQLLGNRLRAEVDCAHAGGMLTAYTVHTGVMPILDYLASLNFDSIMHIDIAFKGVDLPIVKQKLTPAKSLWTGPSSTHHLWRGPEATRQAVREVFEVFGKTGLVLSQCVSSHSIMPWESTVAMVEEWRRLR